MRADRTRSDCNTILLSLPLHHKTKRKRYEKRRRNNKQPRFAQYFPLQKHHNEKKFLFTISPDGHVRPQNATTDRKRRLERTRCLLGHHRKAGNAARTSRTTRIPPSPLRREENNTCLPPENYPGIRTFRTGGRRIFHTERAESPTQK